MKLAALLLTNVLALTAIGASTTALVQRPDEVSSTPAELVAAYDSLAGVILGAKATEHNLVRSVLSATYRHAEGLQRKAKRELAGGADAGATLESLAALVAQLGNEGDARIAAVRKRLLEGGHHHNAAGEQQGLYDEGFVVVTRAARKEFLEIAGRIGRQSQAPAVAALEAEWAKVAAVYGRLTAE